jgi:hypothetical protein
MELVDLLSVDGVITGELAGDYEPRLGGVSVVTAWPPKPMVLYVPPCFRDIWRLFLRFPIVLCMSLVMVCVQPTSIAVTTYI